MGENSLNERIEITVMLSMQDIIIRLLLGTALGGIIGFEREAHGRPAGFRTHLLVSLASVLIMIVSEQYYHISSVNPDFIRIDPARIAAGAITGVGFLGAGVIIKSGFSVQGLTTAACLWIVSAIGLSVGAGLYTPAAISTVISFLALWSLRGVERGMATLTFKHLTIAADSPDKDQEIEKVVQGMKIKIVNMDYEYDAAINETRFNMTISMRGSLNLRNLFRSLTSIEGVKRVSLKKG
jgi:putative Mg2+ transporter-C (MgtC) family protein